MDFNKMSLCQVIAICEHHIDILMEASKLRRLNSEELEFWVSFDLFNCGLMEEIDFRAEAQKYIQDGQGKR